MRTKNVQTGVFRFGLSLFLLALVLSCAGPGPRPGRTVTIPPREARPSLSIAELEQHVHILINKERRKKGLAPLSWNKVLAGAARKHSQDMARNNYFSHKSADGRGFPYRYEEAGFSCAVVQGNTVYTGAENIFQNNLYDRSVTIGRETRYDWNSLDKIAETTVEGWMNSPGHRKNILTPFWRSEGIGIAVSPDDKVYITQNFC